jgi:hypothetical protein
MQVDGAVSAGVQFVPAGERDLRGRLTALELEGMKPFEQFGEPERPQYPLGPAELGRGNEQVAVGIAATAGRVQPIPLAGMKIFKSFF